MDDQSTHLSVDHPILVEILHDSLLSGNLRTKAFNLTLIKRDQFDAKLRPFVVSIGRYVFVLGLGPGYFEEPPCPNADPTHHPAESVRLVTLSMIGESGLPDDLKRVEARKALTSSLNMLRDRYDVVCSRFTELNSELHQSR
jgi:hypothetical protein